EGDDLGQVLRHPRRHVRRNHLQGHGVLFKLLNEARGQRLRILPGLFRRVNNLVIYVGEVADVSHLESAVAQIADDYVARGEGSCVADVDVTVDGWTAYVEAHLSRTKWHQLLLAASERVENLNLRCLV